MNPRANVDNPKRIVAPLQRLTPTPITSESDLTCEGVGGHCCKGITATIPRATPTLSGIISELSIMRKQISWGLKGKRSRKQAVCGLSA